jgi:molybdopterin molybdotransferase
MDRTLVEIEDARRMVLDRVRPLEAEDVPLRKALGRVLAEGIVAPEPVPGFDNSAMDGFAVRAADTMGASEETPVVLRLAGESSAGHPAAASVGEGEAIAISTGAMVPGGADAVIRVEDTAARDGEVEARAEVEAGRNVRRAGEDIAAGERVLEPGSLVGPAELGVIGSAARPVVSCARRPRVHVVVSGDELIGPGDEMRPGAVRDSNAYTVPALAQAAGAELAGIEHVGDDAEATREAIGRALAADIAVVCGGVSVGVHDHVRPSLDALGADEVFWGVALRPGKPTWFGTAPSGGFAFGLPGNPVSAMVTFILFARPAALAMQGRDPAAPRATAVLEEGYRKKPGRAHAIRCALRAGDEGWLARPTKEQGSHVLTSMLGADALAILPTESGDLQAGDRVTVEFLPGPTIWA